MLLANEPSKASRQLYKLLKLSPDHHLGRLLLGLSLMLSGKPDYMPYLREGSVDPESVKFLGLLATALRRQGKREEVERVYEAGFELGLFMSKWQRSASDSQFHLR